ncbi:MAG: hypothetical protein KGV44_13135 [Flavobacteriaceae bacterium]|nr:hypothetical protein [Flavobacteriaceae bacterium]
MKGKWIYVRAVLLLCFVGVLVGFSHYKNRTQKIVKSEKSFEGENNLFMTFPMIDSLLIQSGKKIEGQLKSNINLFILEQKIKAHPLVKNADVSTTVDGVLNVVVEQRKPVARVVGAHSYYIDESAEKMPLSTNHSARVFTVSGNVKEENYKEIYKIVKKIEADDFLKKQLVGIEKLDNGDYQLFPRIGNHTILLGDTKNLHNKMMNLKFFYKKMLKENLIDKYSKINLQYNNQVIGTKK